MNGVFSSYVFQLIDSPYAGGYRL